MKKLGVVLLNLGGPTSEEAVRTFLYNLFNDQDIIKLGGGWAQNSLAKLISKFRYQKIADKYREINGCPKGCAGSKYCPNRLNKVISDCCSPINSLTEIQRRALEKALKPQFPDYDVKVYTVMRYWVPSATDVMQEMMDDEIDQIVLLPLYPQFSWTTTGSSLREWETVRGQMIAAGKDPDWDEISVKSYHRNHAYLEAVNDRIDEALAGFSVMDHSKVHLIFTAHGTPLAEVESGDPYTSQITDTVEAVMDLRNRKENYWISYQSRVGPQKWTQPNTEDLVFRLLEYGVRNMLLVPIAFVTDHIETLHELGIELPEAIQAAGLHADNIVVTKGLNDHPMFIQALVDEVKFRVGVKEDFNFDYDED